MLTSTILSNIESAVFVLVKLIGCIINGVDGRNSYQCHFLIKKVDTIKFSC